MAKFQKRLSKASNKPFQNALVVGEGFGFLSNITEIFNTVFVISKNPPSVKKRNLVYKENFDDLHLLIDISHIFFDIRTLDSIPLVSQVFTRWKSVIIIEGNTIPNKEFTQSMLNTGYKCYRLDGMFHPWELK